MGISPPKTLGFTWWPWHLSIRFIEIPKSSVMSCWWSHFVTFCHVDPFGLRLYHRYGWLISTGNREVHEVEPSPESANPRRTVRWQASRVKHGVLEAMDHWNRWLSQKNSIHSGFSSLPCLITGRCKQIGRKSMGKDWLSIYLGMTITESFWWKFFAISAQQCGFSHIVIFFCSPS